MRDEYLAREDGRRLQVRVVGAQEGPLVVYHHGSPSSRLDVDVLDVVSRDRGVRVAAFDRPGYGRSDPQACTMASIAEDAAAVADLLGAHHFHVAGQSSGGPHALATGAYLSHRVTSVATGGGGAWFAPDLPRWDKLTTDEQQGILLCGVDDAEAERLLAAADSEYMDAYDLDDAGLLDFWRSGCGPADQAYLDGGFAPFLVPSLRESVSQGQRGWARDNVIRMPKWPFELTELTVPVFVWHGEQDTPDADVWVSQQIPRATLRLVADRGHFVLFQNWDQVLDDLLGVT